MRLLLFHADSFAFRTRGNGDADPEAPEASAETAARTERAGERDECLVVFVTVEAGDSTAPDAVVAGAREEIVSAADDLRTGSVVLYPTAGLCTDPADHGVAARIVGDLERALSADRDVLGVPADWATTVELSAKGHPFAEQSRRVRAGDAGDRPDREPSEWRVAVPDGTSRSVAEYREEVDGHGDAGTSAPENRAAILDRLDAEGDSRPGGADREGDDRPGGVDGYRATARESGLIETDADAGVDAPRFSPEGTFVRDAIDEFVRVRATAEGAIPVETATAAVATPGQGTDMPAAADDAGPIRRAVAGAGAAPAVRSGVLSALERIGAETDAGAGSPGIHHTAVRAVGGDGSRQGTRPTSTVPELWTATTGLSAAREALTSQAVLVRQVATAMALDPVPLLRVTTAFARRYGEWIESLVATLGEPVPIERRSGVGDAWPVALSFVAVVAGRAVETGSIRLALDGHGRFGLDVAGASGGRIPLLCSRPVGSVERATVTTGARAATRDPPRLPTWLSPTQVRLVPTDPEAYRDTCTAIAGDLEAAGIRADIDDRARPVGERLDRADADWVPYDAVIGSAQAAGGPLDVTDRETGSETRMPITELQERVRADVDGRLGKRRYLPLCLSERPGVDSG